ncbi:hypothetical protein ACHAWF_018869 [Thalassiosira exigua]
MALGVVAKAILLSAASATVEGFLGGGLGIAREMASPACPPPSARRSSSLASTASSTSPSSASTASSTAGGSEGGGIRGVIFDIDGTLADSWNLGYRATLTVLAEHRGEDPETYPLTAEEYHYGCRYTTPERLARHVGLDPADPSFDSVGEELGRKFDDYYVALVTKETAGFYDGIGDLLVRLNCGELSGSEGIDASDGGSESTGDGVQLGALTNACVAYAHAVLKANCPRHSSDVPPAPDAKDDSIYPRFSSIHGADSVPRPKPYGDGIRKCCEEMNLHPSQVIYVGDAPTDARAAVDAECRAAIGVLWGSNDEECLEKEEGFRALCGDVEELGRAIEKYL